MSIFRREVIERQTKRLEGNVSLALPLSWQIFGGLFFVIVISAIAFFLVGSYARIERVEGSVQPAAGVARVVPSAAGTLDDLFVEAGQTVSAGDALAVVRTGLTLSGGVRSSDAQLRNLRDQQLALGRQASQIGSAAASRADELDREIAGRQDAISSYLEEIEIQSLSVRNAKENFDQATKVAERGFVSKQDLSQREERYFASRQELLRLRRDLEQNRNAIAEARQKKATIQAEANAQAESLGLQQSEIAQSLTRSDQQEAYQLTSPIAGKVAVIDARLGDSVSAGEPLMLILPKGSPLIAELKVPSSSIGFLARGQEVRLAVDAYPYQHFGTIPAQITSIASAPVLARAGDGSEERFYLVTASLKRDWILAYGKRQPLIAGMVCSAEIVTEKRTIIEWLLSPLISARAS